ncbi:MAG: hypothetical protein AAF749_07870 [Pseudomonadota bacterium]
MRVAAFIIGLITVWASSHSLAQDWQDILKKHQSKTATVTTPIATVGIVDPNGQELPCQITEATTLRGSAAAVDYRAACRIDVTAPLTIEAGVVIHFEADAGLGLYEGGTLTAGGTAERPITLRGAKDQIGFWRGIHSEGSLALRHVRIANAGGNYVYCCNSPAAVFARSGSVLLEQVEFTQLESCEVYARQRVNLTIDGQRNSKLDERDICTGGGYLPADVNRGTRLIATERAVDYFVKAGQVVNITKSLTIDPGVVIEFEENAGLGVYDAGVLNAQGTEDRPIVLRGKEDLPGYWRGVHTESQALLEHVEVKNAGSTYVYCCNGAAGVFAKGGSLDIKNSALIRNQGCAISATTSTELSIQDNRYENNEADVCADPVPLPISIREDTVLRRSGREVDYYAPDNQVTDITAKLSIEAGVIIEMGQNSGLGVYDSGSLLAQGDQDQPIVFKGKEDRPGYWRGIHTESQALLEHVELKNAGSTYVYCCNGAAGILGKGGSLELRSSALTGNQGCALSATTSTNLSIQDSQFESNEADICADPVPLPASIQEDTVLRRSGREVDYYVPDDQVTDITARLSIEAGVTIEMGRNSGLGFYDAGTLQANGTTEEPIAIRGIQDQIGYWRGIYSEKSLLLKHVQISNAGRDYVYCCNQPAAIFARSGSVALESVEFAKQQSCEVYARQRVDLLINGERNPSLEQQDICTAGGYLPSDIRRSTRLIDTESEVDYIVQAGQVVNVTQALTIDPGVVIEFEENAGLGVYDTGGLYAQGTADNPIVLKGAEDRPGYWRGVHTESQALLEHVELKNAGANYVYCCNAASGVLAKGGTLDVKSSVFRDNQGCALSAKTQAQLTLDQNSFLNNEADICADAQYLPEYINQPLTLRHLSRPVDYIVRAGQVTNVTAKLTIEPGVIIEFESNSGLGVYDNGELYAVGTKEAPIVMQGKLDEPGYWRGIHTETDATLEHVEISNAGSSYVYCCHQSAAVYAKRGSLTAKANLFRSNDNCALFASDDVSLSAADNRFENHFGDPLCPAGLTQMASEQKTLPTEQSTNQVASSDAGSQTTRGGDLTKTPRKMADAVKTPGSVVKGPKMRLCPKIYQCYAKQDVRNAIRDLSYRVTPGDSEFCEQLWGWFGSADCASDEQLKFANNSFGIIYENEWLRCDPLENYLKELKQRWDSGEDTQEAEEQLEAGYLKAFGSFLGDGGPEAFCEAIMEGIR